MRDGTMIRSLRGLCDHFGADSPAQLNRRLYKDTACGASISVQTPDGAWWHSGQDWRGVKRIRAFTIQTIVEGSVATVVSPVFVLPVRAADVDAWIVEMEEEADMLWREANEDDDEQGGDHATA